MGTGKCRGLMLAAAMLAVIVPVRAAGADRIGQRDGNVTQLGMRLAPLAARHAGDARGGAYWREARALMDASRPARDAEADAAAGHAGFMTHANDSFAERPMRQASCAPTAPNRSGAASSCSVTRHRWQAMRARPCSPSTAMRGPITCTG